MKKGEDKVLMALLDNRMLEFAKTRLPEEGIP